MSKEQDEYISNSDEVNLSSSTTKVVDKDVDKDMEKNGLGKKLDALMVDFTNQYINKQSDLSKYSPEMLATFYDSLMGTAEYSDNDSELDESEKVEKISQKIADDWSEQSNNKLEKNLDNYELNDPDLTVPDLIDPDLTDPDLTDTDDHDPDLTDTDDHDPDVSDTEDEPIKTVKKNADDIDLNNGKDINSAYINHLLSNMYKLQKQNNTIDKDGVIFSVGDVFKDTNKYAQEIKSKNIDSKDNSSEIKIETSKDTSYDKLKQILDSVDKNKLSKSKYSYPYPSLPSITDKKHKKEKTVDKSKYTMSIANMKKYAGGDYINSFSEYKVKPDFKLSTDGVLNDGTTHIPSSVINSVHSCVYCNKIYTADMIMDIHDINDKSCWHCFFWMNYDISMRKTCDGAMGLTIADYILKCTDDHVIEGCIRMSDVGGCFLCEYKLGLPILSIKDGHKIGNSSGNTIESKPEKLYFPEDDYISDYEDEKRVVVYI
jgi:hypothetical protein